MTSPAELVTAVPALDRDEVASWRGDGFRMVIGERATSLLKTRHPYTVLAGYSSQAVIDRLPGMPHRIDRIPPGRPAELAPGLLRRGADETIVAVGGGRVIDTAKIIASVTGQSVVAVPTTLSGAEVTHFHALPWPEGRPTRPVEVLWEPGTLSGLHDQVLYASLANALAHLIEAAAQPSARRARPDTVAACAVVVKRLVGSLDGSARAETWASDAVLISVLAGHALDASGLGPLHVLAQSLAATGAAAHATIYAGLLSAAIPLLRERRPAELAALEAVLGLELEPLALGLAERSGSTELGAKGIDDDALRRAVELALQRRELGRIPPAPTAELIAEIYRSAL